MNRHTLFFAFFLLAPALYVPPAEAARCALPKSTGQIRLVKFSLASAEKAGGKAIAGETAALRSRLGGLTRSGGAFAGKAAPIEAECRALTATISKLRAAKRKRDAARKAILAQIKRLDAEFKRVVTPRGNSIRQEADRYFGIGCGKNRKVKKPLYERCEAWRMRLEPRFNSHKSDVKRRKSQRKQLVQRIKALNAEYEKLRRPLKARYAKYKASLKAYQAERKAWAGELRQVWAKANALALSAYRARAKARREAAARRARLAMAKKLRGQVKGIQEALRRLSRSMRGDAAERRQWERATNQAMENAWNRGKGMIVDESLGVLGKRLKAQLSSANKQIRRAVDLLAGTKEPQRRERLHAAIKLMNRQREEIKRAKNLVVDRISDAKKVTDAVDYATSNPGDLEKSLRGTYELVKTTLGDPKVQKALKIGGKYAKGAGYAQSIADSAYDISAEVVSWKRINQLNRNSDAYLKAVNRLKGKMESRMKRIHELEGKK